MICPVPPSPEKKASSKPVKGQPHSKWKPISESISSKSQPPRIPFPSHRYSPPPPPPNLLYPQHHQGGNDQQQLRLINLLLGSKLDLLTETLSTQLGALDKTLGQRLLAIMDEFKGFAANVAVSNEEEVTRAVAEHLQVDNYDLGRRGRDPSGRILYEADGLVWMENGTVAVVEGSSQATYGGWMTADWDPLLNFRLTAKQRVEMRDVDMFLKRLSCVEQVERRSVFGFIGGPLFPHRVRDYAKECGLQVVVLSGQRFQVKSVEEPLQQGGQDTTPGSQGVSGGKTEPTQRYQGNNTK